jgi:hypothetical protein
MADAAFSSGKLRSAIATASPGSRVSVQKTDRIEHLQNRKPSRERLDQGSIFLDVVQTSVSYTTVIGALQEFLFHRPTSRDDFLLLHKGVRPMRKTA